MTMYYMIVYPSGDRSKLSVQQVRDYERNEWALASRELFDNTEEGKKEAQEYAAELAKKHNLRYDYPGKQDYLD